MQIFQDRMSYWYLFKWVPEETHFLYDLDKDKKYCFKTIFYNSQTIEQAPVLQK